VIPDFTESPCNPNNPKIRDTIFVHANFSGLTGDLQPFLCLGAGAADAYGKRQKVWGDGE
jgi:hypothetical protein